MREPAEVGAAGGAATPAARASSRHRGSPCGRLQGANVIVIPPDVLDVFVDSAADTAFIRGGLAIPVRPAMRAGQSAQRRSGVSGQAHFMPWDGAGRLWP